MPGWKYAKPKAKPREYPYLQIPDDVELSLTITNWNFEKNPYNDSLFGCSVVEINGEKADKIWSVWNFELKEQLKKSLKTKKPNKDHVKIKIKKHPVDEVDDSFEFSLE